MWERLLICEVKVSTGEIFREKLPRALVKKATGAIALLENKIDKAPAHDDAVAEVAGPLDD